ncbi:hypothetical protein LUX73_41415 [Actinomadura madurae]|nr:hypothetical protein [Actinomadura madurae]MCQ0010524.1 hypothetical protein [Actinomadura madurae]
MAGDTLTRERIGHLYDYLSALAQEVYAKPVRHVGDHDVAVSPGDLPAHPAVRAGAAAGEAWLRVGKVARPLPPGLPGELREPFRDVVRDDPYVAPEIPDDLAWRVRALTEDDPAAVRVRAAFEEWREQVWTPWAEAAREAMAARRLYETLFRLRQRMRADEATHELVWGHGVLGWKHGGHRVCHPLLITRARIAFDERSGEISIVPDGIPALELDCLQGLGVPGIDQLNAVVEEVRDTAVDPWAPDGTRALYRRILAPLGLDDRLEDGPDLPDAGPSPVMAETWRLFVRRRRVMFLRFFERLKAAVADGERQPAPMVALAAGEDAARDALAAAAPTGRRSPSSCCSPRGQRRAGADRAQARPAQRRHRAGPARHRQEPHDRQPRLPSGRARQAGPGHRAQGPGARRPAREDPGRAAGPVAGGTGVVVRGPHRAAAVRPGDHGRGRRRRRGARGEGDGRAPRAARPGAGDVAVLRKRLRDSLEREQESLEVGGFRRTAAEVADWLAENEEVLARIPDPLTTASARPLDASELAEFYALAGAIERRDAAAATLDLPAAGRLPTGADLAARWDELRRLGEALAASGSTSPTSRASTASRKRNSPRSPSTPGRRRARLKGSRSRGWRSCASRSPRTHGGTRCGTGTRGGSPRTPGSARGSARSSRGRRSSFRRASPAARPSPSWSRRGRASPRAGACPRSCSAGSPSSSRARAWTARRRGPPPTSTR